MNKQREALELALLALEIAPLDHNSVKSSFFEKRHYAIIALREALAEPEQEPEPVAWIVTKAMDSPRIQEWKPKDGDYLICESLYIAPPARKPLTTEQINSLGDKIANEKLVGPVMDFRERFARAIERAHGIGEP